MLTMRKGKCFTDTHFFQLEMRGASTAEGDIRVLAIRTCLRLSTF
jgi:hypothetical protein